jgi:hypothetical protein
LEKASKDRRDMELFIIKAHPTFLWVSMKIELSSPLCERGDEGGIDFENSILP